MFRAMAVEKIEVREGYHIEHPNQEKAANKATKAVVILLLLASVGLMLIVTSVAGRSWPDAEVLIGYMLVYLVMAFYAARWNRGVLPVVAALAIILRSSRRSPGRSGSSATRPASAHRRSTRASSASSRC